MHFRPRLRGGVEGSKGEGLRKRGVQGETRDGGDNTRRGRVDLQEEKKKSNIRSSDQKGLKSPKPEPHLVDGPKPDYPSLQQQVQLHPQLGQAAQEQQQYYPQQQPSTQQTPQEANQQHQLVVESKFKSLDNKSSTNHKQV